MKLAILSRNANLYSTSRLRQAAEARGHSVRVIDYLRCYMNITAHRPAVMLQGVELTDIEAVIPRIGASHTFYGTAVVRQFEMMGTFTANESQAISRGRDKLRALQLLARNGIGLPVTGFAHSTKDIDGLLDTVGGPPVVLGDHRFPIELTLTRRDEMGFRMLLGRQAVGRRFVIHPARSFLCGGSTVAPSSQVDLDAATV